MLQNVDQDLIPNVSLGKIWCPVKGCKNFGGKGYMRSYIFKHLKSHVVELSASEAERVKLNKHLRTFSNHVCCKECCHVVAQANDEGVCISCLNETSSIGVITDCKDEVAVQEIKNRIRNANKTHLRILSDIPRSLQRLWGSCVTATIMKFAKSKTELESFLALECWVKLKSTLVLPLKAGKQRRSATHKFHERQMLMWLSANYDECRKISTAIEQKREILLKKKKNIQKNKRELNRKEEPKNILSDKLQGDELSREEKQMYKRAKNYVNVGELRKAMTAIRSNGIAEVDKRVLEQLQAKHPQRLQPVAFPPMDIIKSRLVHNSIVEEDMKEESIQQEEGKLQNKSDEFSQHVSTVLNSILSSVTVTADNILSAAKLARRLTSGGLQQITPWHLKRALLSDTNQAGAIAASRLATRWARGDFSRSLGELVAESQLIALYKDNSKMDVRPFGIGCALRRLLTRAYCAKTRDKIIAHCRESQLGLLKGGYEVGVHAMRELAKQAKLSGWVIMLLDFANAFNSVDRNLLLKLACAHCPELAKLTLWLYGVESHLVTTRGDTLKSSTGTQQGCTLSNPLFALTMEFISTKIKNIEGLRVHQFYWDDTALVGSAEAVAIAARTIQDLSSETGLHLKWKKCHLHGTPEVIECCKKMSEPGFSQEVTFHETLDMVYLKAPIGSEKYVSFWLERKINDLSQIIQSISRMPYRHEACTLLRSCAAECRVTYLTRILPPRQIASFMKKFDAVLRKGFEDLVGKSLEDKWWRLAQLPAKFGGMAMRSGLLTFGAQHIVSLTKTSAEVKRIVGFYDAFTVAERETELWLTKACGGEVTVEQIVKEINDKQRKEDALGLEIKREKSYSVAQRCEIHEHRKVCGLMSPEERIHIEAHSGANHTWVTVIPLSFKQYNMTSAVWRTSVLKRLRQDVVRVERQCTFCKWSRGDIWGEHATMCSGGCSRNMRHNTVRDLIAKAAIDLGYRTDFEHGGGLGDHRRPGDVIVYNWRDGKHLLIDVAVVNPLCVSHADNLVKNGVGGSATAYESHKINTYKEIDSSIYDFVPFIIETCGGVGRAALRLCKELEDRLEAKEYWKNKVGHESGWRNFPNALLTAINIEVQRFNSRMILERQPPRCNLIETAFSKCEVEVAKKKIEAAKILQSSYRLTKHNQSISCIEATSSVKPDRWSPDWRSELQIHDENVPPDPPKANKKPKLRVHYDPVSVVEHPLAKITYSNSRPVSTSTKTCVSALKQRKERNEMEIGSKLTQKRVLKGKDGKDDDAMHWEPPKLERKSQVWEENQG